MLNKKIIIKLEKNKVVRSSYCVCDGGYLFENTVPEIIIDAKIASDLPQNEVKSKFLLHDSEKKRPTTVQSVISLERAQRK